MLLTDVMPFVTDGACARASPMMRATVVTVRFCVPAQSSMACSSRARSFARIVPLLSTNIPGFVHVTSRPGMD